MRGEEGFRIDAQVARVFVEERARVGRGRKGIRRRVRLERFQVTDPDTGLAFHLLERGFRRAAQAFQLATRVFRRPSWVDPPRAPGPAGSGDVQLRRSFAGYQVQ